MLRREILELLVVLGTSILFAETDVCWYFPWQRSSVRWAMGWGGVCPTWGSHLICTDTSQPGLLGFFLGGNHLLWKIELLQDKKFSVFLVLFVFCCSSMKKTRPVWVSTGSCFMIPKKVFVVTSEATRKVKYSLQRSCWTRVYFSSLLWGCVRLVWKDSIPWGL